MASQFDVLKSVQDLVNAALSPGGNPLTFYQAAIGYPSIGGLQQVAKTGVAAVAVYDRKISKNTTRWAPYVFSQTVVPATLTTALAPNRIAPGQSATITLGGTVTLGDAVSALAVRVGGLTGAVVAVSVQNDSPTSMAAKLANMINTDSSMLGMLTAAAVGAVVTVKNVANVALQLGSYAGNGGSQQREIGRREQQMQVILWARTVEQRNLMVAALETAIALSEINFGPLLPDGTQGRLSYVSDYDLEDDTLEDVYRHDFMVAMDYPVTTTDLLFAVLAPVLTITIQLEVGQQGSGPSTDFSDPGSSQFLPGLV